jgi:hypothetical protein
MEVGSLGMEFAKLKEEWTFIPVHQFEYFGCFSKKWKLPTLGATGFIFQDLTRMELE